jgi:CTP-dependent riboflavin kinase
LNYHEIRENQSRVKFQVMICSGKGLGKNFVNSLQNSDPIILMLGATPYPGTLFVKLKKPINLSGLAYSASNGEIVEILPAYLQGKAVVLKWTKRYPNNLQIISSFHLRSELGLIDGQYSELHFAAENLHINSLGIYWSSFLQWLKATRLASFRRKLLVKLWRNSQN